MKMKPISPYQRLVNEAREWVYKVRHPSTTPMFRYEKGARQDASYTLHELYERTKAADALGYDVLVRAENGAIHIDYVKRAPEPPNAINTDF